MEILFKNPDRMQASFWMSFTLTLLSQVKKEVKKERLNAGLGNPEEDDGAPSSDDEDEDKYVDKMDMPGTKVDAAERYTVRNLRIREDTAKYLRNLDLR